MSYMWYYQRYVILKKIFFNKRSWEIIIVFWWMQNRWSIWPVNHWVERVNPRWFDVWSAFLFYIWLVLPGRGGDVECSRITWAAALPDGDGDGAAPNSRGYSTPVLPFWNSLASSSSRRPVQHAGQSAKSAACEPPSTSTGTTWMDRPFFRHIYSTYINQ